MQAGSMVRMSLIRNNHMVSKSTSIIESDIYDITIDNVADKLKDHFDNVIKAVKYYEMPNAKLVTRIRELNYKETLISTEVEERVKKLSKK